MHSIFAEHVGHWEDLETWLSIATDSLLPKAAETRRHQTQDQLDDNITSLMAQDPSHSYNHKKLAKITGSLSHTLIATLKLSDKHAAQRQQELTRAQRRIEQLELEAQERREGSDEAEQGEFCKYKTLFERKCRRMDKYMYFCVTTVRLICLFMRKLGSIFSQMRAG